MNQELNKLKAAVLRTGNEQALTELIALCEHEAFDKGVEYATVAQMEVQKRMKNFKRERKKPEPVMAW
jgi:hypothetical protein